MLFEFQLVGFLPSTVGTSRCFGVLLFLGRDFSSHRIRGLKEALKNAATRLARQRLKDGWYRRRWEAESPVPLMKQTQKQHE